MADPIRLPVDTDEGNVQLTVEEVRVVEAVSPTVTAERDEDGVMITVHDLNGTRTAHVDDGETGEAGRGIVSTALNQDFTLSVTFTDGTTWTSPMPIRGATGATPDMSIGTVQTLPAGSQATAQISGTAEQPVLSLGIPKGDPGSVPIDDTAGAGDTTKVWSADKSAAEVSDLKSAINTLEPKVDSLEINKADVIISSASGSIASFSDGADGMPVKELTVGIEPVQDLHGYDSPWPAGGGKNLLDPSKRISENNGYRQRWYKEDGYTLKANTTYTLSVQFNSPIALYIIDHTTDAVIVNGNSPLVYTPTEDTLVFIQAYRAEDISLLDTFQLELGSTATDYSPYSNICPITGWDSANVQAAGANLWDEEWEVGSINASGQPQTSTTRIRSKNFISVRPDINYCYYNGASISCDFFYYKDDGTFISSERLTTGTSGTSKVFTTPPLCTKIKFAPTSGYGTTYNHDISINYPASDTAYHLGHVQTIPITFPSEAGTVYGGTLNPVTGELVVDRMMVQIRAAQNKSTDANDNYFWYSTSTTLGVPNIKGLNAKLISNRMTEVTNTTITDPDGSITFYANGIIRWKEQGALILSEYNSYLSENPLEICYEIENPTTYTLTPTEVRTLLGQNSIWADTGDVAVEYRADTKTYVDAKEPEIPVQDVQVNGVSVVQDGVANVPVADITNPGTVKMGNSGNTGLMMSSGVLKIDCAGAAHTKQGTNLFMPIVPYHQHESTFYGLAKAAGDITQSASSNAVGTYTESAKSAISQMLSGSVSVSGTTPTITALPGVRYVCGEVSTLDVTVPASGIVDVVFTSGSTPTVLTVTPPSGMTMKWANGFDPTALEADTTYEINVMDGCLGVAGTWS